MFRNTKYLDKSLPYKISVATTSQTTTYATTSQTTMDTTTTSRMGILACESACEYNVIPTWPKDEWTPSYEWRNCNKPVPLKVCRQVCEFSVNCNIGSITCGKFVKYCLNVFVLKIILVK